MKEGDLEFIRDPESIPFGIKAEEWEALVRFLVLNLGVRSGVSEFSKSFEHPWKVRVEWLPAFKAWGYRVNAGFVRALDVWMPRAVGALASSATQERYAEDDEPIGDEIPARLTEFPWSLIAEKDWNIDASDSKVLLEEPPAGQEVPEVFFTLYNVVRPPKVKIEAGFSGIKVDASDKYNGSRSISRQLRSVYVYLRHPRPQVVTVTQEDGGIPGGLVVKKFPRFMPDDTSPEVRHANVMPNPVVLKSPEGLDTYPYELVPIARVWMLSPPGDLTSEFPDNRWTPIVSQMLHWNLDYTANVDVEELPPLRFINPALGLQGAEQITQALTDDLNRRNAEAEALWSKASVEGAFWNV